MLELIILRHSISIGNEKKLFLGRMDLPLSARGVALAKRRCAAIPGVPLVYSSPLSRARQTAELVWPGTEILLEPGLREMDFGEFDGLTHEENMLNPSYVKWLEGGRWEDYPGGESMDEARARSGEALRRIARDAAARGLSFAGAVGHYGSIMLIAELFTDIRIGAGAGTIRNCTGFRMQIENAGENVRVLSAERI